ncbi:uncharacterized protein LOC119390395 isoform X6 [Rhipicephalus sanguineus]|uniref:uncharacterized protein LOC119390395 isoform X6 n=1 Tax=Rhipicephalus sanguineus TaxID=34632 RepID=UPI0020C37D86|nr:uncharacterized protein LOC119390395 isoform X6 [Rhipicephalus sanguineus]
MIFVKCCLVLIATWTLYTQAKPTNHVTEERQDSDYKSHDSGNFLLIKSRSLHNTIEKGEHVKKPHKPHKKHTKECTDGQGHRVPDGVGCSFYKLEEKRGPQHCWVGICKNGTCRDLIEATCSDY